MVHSIRNAIDRGDTIAVHCANPSCLHRADLVLRRLGQRLGFEHGCMHDDLKDKFRCTKCNGREVTFIHSCREATRASQATYFGTAYAKSKGR